MRYSFILLFAVVSVSCGQSDSRPEIKLPEGESYQVPDYPWKAEVDPEQTLLQRFPTPDGYKRVPLNEGTFGYWLRGLPLKPGNPPIHYYNGNQVEYQGGHAAVIDLDVGNRDLQQCADAIIRLRGEYLWSADKANMAAFRFTSGDLAEFREWATGMRPIVSGNTVGWTQQAQPDSSYESYRAYLENVFMYAGTMSLQKELNKILHRTAQPGDVIIQGGSPGHGVLILDMAVDSVGNKIMLLGQSYMPAQEMHVLKNLKHPEMGAWFSNEFQLALQTPQWTFNANDYYRFGE